MLSLNFPRVKGRHVFRVEVPAWPGRGPHFLYTAAALEAAVVSWPDSQAFPSLEES